MILELNDYQRRLIRTAISYARFHYEDAYRNSPSNNWEQYVKDMNESERLLLLLHD